jgi:hypothetical protein
VASAARQHAASDTGGGTTWLHGFGRGSLAAVRSDISARGLEGGSKWSSSPGATWVSGFR